MASKRSIPMPRFLRITRYLRRSGSSDSGLSHESSIGPDDVMGDVWQCSSCSHSLNPGAIAVCALCGSRRLDEYNRPRSTSADGDCSARSRLGTKRRAGRRHHRRYSCGPSSEVSGSHIVEKLESNPQAQAANHLPERSSVCTTVSKTSTLEESRGPSMLLGKGCHQTSVNGTCHIAGLRRASIC